MSWHLSSRTLLALSWLLPSSLCIAAYQTGDIVVQHGNIEEDFYVAGGQVDIAADVTGDLLVAGGEVSVDTRVSGDLMMVGGELSLRGQIADDVRMAGGKLRLSGTIGGDFVATGGDIKVSPGTTIGGNVLLCGGRINLSGQVRGDASLCGGELQLSGRIDGDVDLTGPSIRIGPGAVIRGNLRYRSPHEADIDPQASIAGTVTHIEMPMTDAGEITAGIVGAGLIIWLGLALTGVVLHLLLPRAAQALLPPLNDETLKVTALGLAMFASMPLLALILFASGIGALLGGLLMACYGLLIVLGLLGGVLCLSDFLLRQWRKERPPSRLAISLMYFPTLLVVLIIGLIPFLGWLLIFLLLLSGMGSIGLQLHRSQWH